MSKNQNHPLNLIIDKLTCVRGDKMLFEDLSFNVQQGEVLEIKGPNGVGKSSLLRIIAGLAPAYSGAVLLSESTESDLVVEENVHFLSHQNALKDGLSVLDNLIFWHRFCDTPSLSPHEALLKVALPHLAELPVGVLSAGQKRRVAFARLLVAHRPIWLLDEPTAALDKAADEQVGALISEHAAAGGMVLAATHLPLKIDAKSATLKTIELKPLNEGQGQ